MATIIDWRPVVAGQLHMIGSTIREQLIGGMAPQDYGCKQYLLLVLNNPYRNKDHIAYTAIAVLDIETEQLEVLDTVITIAGTLLDKDSYIGTISNIDLEIIKKGIIEDIRK